MSNQDFTTITGVSTLIIMAITAYFMYRALYSPIDAVKIGRQLSQEQEKDRAKRNLFLMLFSLRGSPVHYDFVRGLNQIEVVFQDVPQVLSAWRTHYASLGNREQANKEKNWEIERAALLSAMAVDLGYSNIPHGELLRDYYPEGHENQLKDDLLFRSAALSYFQKGVEIYEHLIENYQATKEKS